MSRKLVYLAYWNFLLHIENFYLKAALYNAQGGNWSKETKEAGVAYWGLLHG